MRRRAHGQEGKSSEETGCIISLEGQSASTSHRNDALPPGVIRRKGSIMGTPSILSDGNRLRLRLEAATKSPRRSFIEIGGRKGGLWGRKLIYVSEQTPPSEKKSIMGHGGTFQRGEDVENEKQLLRDRRITIGCHVGNRRWPASSRAISAQ